MIFSNKENYLCRLCVAKLHILKLRIRRVFHRERLNYLYRLCAAKLYILKLRIRRIFHEEKAKQLRSRSNKTGRSSSFTKLIPACCLLVSGVVLGSYFGQRASVAPFIAMGSVAIASDEQSSQFADEQTDQLAAVDNLLFLPPEVLKQQVSVSLAAEQPASDTEYNSIVEDNIEHLVEIDYLNSTTIKLRDRIVLLEWETLILESELLSSAVEVEKAQAQLDRNERQLKETFNITNVPIGGYVASIPVSENEAIETSPQSE